MNLIKKYVRKRLVFEIEKCISEHFFNGACVNKLAKIAEEITYVVVVYNIKE